LGENQSPHRRVRRIAREAVREAVGPDFPVIFRFSQWKPDHFVAAIATNPAELEAVLTPLADAGVDVLHASTRRHYLPAFPDAHPELSLSGWTKKITGLPVIAVGRALIADPGWVDRLRDDTLDGFAGYHPETALARLQ
jgi:2,4-dienoyl-CoA reductase-like NADH-dependent reductase (Old Yellow Enzyme family)